MRYLVPTNFDNKLLENLKLYSSQITLYGKNSVDLIGGGRNSLFLPDPGIEKIFEHIKLARKMGFRFNYLMNASCLGNAENKTETRKELKSFLLQLGETGIDEITVSNTVMLSIIKEILPHVEINIGLAGNIDSLKKVGEFEKMGAKGLTLSVDLNRQFKKLKTIRKNSNSRITLLASLTCLPSCHSMISCMNSLSHSSSDGGNDDSMPVNLPLLNCFFRKLKTPWLILTAPFIRPEDVTHYEKIGIDELKFTDRYNSTDELTNKLNAYINGIYDGNLLDLLSFRLSKSEGSFRDRKLFIPKTKLKSIINMEKELKLSKTPEIIINNRDLDGFLSFFIENDIDCTWMDCDKCSWCKKIGENSIKYNIEQTEAAWKRFISFSKKYSSLNEENLG